MTKSTNDQLMPLVKELQEFAFSQVGSMTILRILGYGLMLLAVFDIVEMFIPLRLMNPAWEFQIFGSLVERVPVPLIGLVLIFYGEVHARSKWEFPILSLLSWLTVLLALLFVLLIPLGVFNTIRLNRQGVEQISTASQQEISKAEKLQQQLSQATPEQISNFLRSQGRPVDSKSPQEVKNQVLSELSQAKEKIETQAKETKSTQNLNLLKNSVKWNLGALVSAALFFNIWKTTRWARSSR